MGAFTLRTTRRLPQRGGELRTQGLAQSKESGLVGERRAPPSASNPSLDQPPLAPQRPREEVAEAHALALDPGSP